MPRNRTKYQAKREHELSAGEILDVCGPSDEATQRRLRTGPSKQEKKRRRRALEIVSRYRRIGRMIRAFRSARRQTVPLSPTTPALVNAKRPRHRPTKRPTTPGAA